MRDLASLSLDEVRALLDAEDSLEDHLPTGPRTLGHLLAALRRRAEDR